MGTHQKPSFLILCLFMLIISCSKKKEKSFDESKSNQKEIGVNDFEKPSIICELDQFDFPKRNFRIVYYDNSYLFVGRNYGSANHPFGNTEPAFFAHSNDFDQWLKIKKITTQKGKFGYGQFSKKLTQEEKRKLSVLSVDISDRHHVGKDYCDLPLKGGSHISFPDKMILDTIRNEYVLEFKGDWEIEAIKTVLRFRKEDLDLAFEDGF